MDSGTYSTVRTNGKAKEVDSAGSDKLVQVLPGKMGECRKVNSALESVLEPPELYSTYKEFIDAHVADWPEYRWMQLFLEQKGKDPSDTSVTVFDSMHGSLVEHDYSSRISSLPHFLRQRPPEVRTRLIIVTHFESWAIDRNVVDTLGKSFDIDPQFFHKHFHTPDNYDMSCERGFPKNHWGMLTSDWTRPLPSESPVLEIGGKDEDHLSAGVYKHGSASSQSHSTSNMHTFLWHGASLLIPALQFSSGSASNQPARQERQALSEQQSEIPPPRVRSPATELSQADTRQP